MHELQWFTDRLHKTVQRERKVGDKIIKSYALVCDDKKAKRLHESQCESGFVYADKVRTSL